MAGSELIQSSSMHTHNDNLAFTLWQIPVELFSEVPRSNKSGTSTLSYGLLLALSVSLMIAALVGFSFYLWYLKCNSNASQNRLLNILHGYFAIFCMSGCVAIFCSLLHTLQLHHGDNDEEGYNQSIRLSGMVYILRLLKGSAS